MTGSDSLFRIGRGARTAFAASLLSGLLLALFVPDAALAQSGARACRQLEAQLASLSGGGGRAAPAQARKYDEAIARQRGQIDKARGQARQAGCGFAVTGRAVAFCGEINATLARMEKNLSELQRQRTKLSGGGDRRERARIAAALDRNGCRAAPRPARSAGVVPGPAEPADAAPRRQMTTVARAGVPARNLSGQFRTMCVRTCDGYYFPVSWSVSQAAFERDGNACQAMCPGTRVELHYHRVSGEDSEDMVSASTGIPYREMDNAFLYRQPGASIPAGCGCGASAQGEPGFQTIGGDYAANAPATQPGPEDGDEDGTVTAAIPLPSVRPDPAEDPETLSTREGGLDAEGLKKLAAPPPAAAANPDAHPREKHVRVVGPAFLPDQEAAIGLQAQDPARAR